MSDREQSAEYEEALAAAGAPMLECLAMHRFQPTYNAAKAETKKWTSKCPLCQVHRNIWTELRAIFRLKG